MTAAERVRLGPRPSTTGPRRTAPWTTRWGNRLTRGPRLQRSAASVTSLLRLRWLWLAAFLYIGAALGALAAGSTGGAGYRATSVLQIVVNTADSNRVAQLAQAAQLLGRSVQVLEEAAAERDTTVRDLAARSTVTRDDASDLVVVNVLADTPQDAIDDANALAEAMLTVTAAQAQERLDILRRQGDQVLSEDVLSDPQAEQARKGALGSAVATRQDDAIASATVLSVLDPAREASSAGLSRVVAGALGGLGGLGLAAAAVVALGARHIRIRDDHELGLLAPELASAAPRIAEEQAGRLLDSGASALVVLCMPGAEDAGFELAERVVRRIHAHGYDAELVDARSATDPSELRVLRRAAGPADGPLEDVARVVVCTTGDETLELVAGQSRLLSLLVLQRKRTTVDDLQYVAAAVATTHPTAVVCS